MVTDIEARNVVRQLMQRLDVISSQAAGVAYVLARKDLKGYARLLEVAEIAEKIVIGPLNEADSDHSQVYAALDDQNADWSKAVLAMLSKGPIVFEGQQALDRLRLTQSLDERFDEEMRKRNKGDGEGPKE